MLHLLSVADAYLLAVLNWCDPAGVGTSGRPVLLDWLTAMRRRFAVAIAMTERPLRRCDTSVCYRRMTMSVEADIDEHEERLRRAMLAGDVAALDRLLGDDAIYTDHGGRRVGRRDDLAAHASGLLRVERIDRLAPALVRVLGDVAVVSVAVDLAGRYAGAPFAGAFAYTRVWRRSDDGWQVEAAHASAVAPAE